MVEGYCMHCQKKVEMQNPQKIATKRGGVRLAGTCPNCGTNLSRFLGASKLKTPSTPIVEDTQKEISRLLHIVASKDEEIARIVSGHRVIQTDMVGADQFYNELSRLGQRAVEAERVAVAESLEKQKIYVAYSIEKKRADDLSAYRDNLVTAHNELYTKSYERESEIAILTERVLVSEKTVAMQRTIIDKCLQQLRAVLPGREFQTYEARIMEMLKASYAMAMQARKAETERPIERPVEAQKVAVV